MKFKKISIIVLMTILIFNFSITFASSDNPKIIAEAAILIDSSSKKILYSKNETQKMYPASTTKILTAILTLENCNLDDIVTVPYDAISIVPSGYSVAALQAGEQLTVEQLLQVMLVHSANDAANVLAFHVSGSINSFADLMNEKIKQIGLQNTHFTNPSGMHDENHYTTAYDLAIMMNYCMKNSTFKKYASLKYCTIPATNKYSERVFDTTNDLLKRDDRDVSSNYYYKYAIAGKTGYTSEAKNCLVSVANKDNLELICVVLGAGLYENGLSAKFIDSKTLFDYGYDNYTIKKLHEKNAIITQIDVENGTKDTKNLDLLISDDITALISKDDLNTEFSPEIKIDEKISAPLAQGKVIGKIVYNINDIEYSADLIASHSVQKSGIFNIALQVFFSVIVLFLLYKILFDGKSKKK